MKSETGSDPEDKTNISGVLDFESL